MKTTKKAFSLLLICAMVLALMLVPVQAADTVTIYVNITGSGWDNVNVYTWNENGPCTGTWPGSAMTHVIGYVYSFEVPVSAKNIIFNDGSAQTADLTIPTDGKNMYIYASGLWGNYTGTCNHNWSLGRCTLCGAVCDHNWIDGICRNCSSACGHRWSQGTCMVCNLVCGHRNWIDGACVDCSWTCSHSFVDDRCTVCGLVDPDKEMPEDVYLVGYINGANYGCEEDYLNLGQYRFVNDQLVATFTEDSYVFLRTPSAWYLSYSYSIGPRCNFYNSAEHNVSEKMLVPGGVEVTFYLIRNDNGSFDLRYTTPAMVCPHEAHNIDGICLACGQQLVHVYQNGVCSCGATEPVTKPVEYFLFGFINGANYACEEDYENMGEYKFVDGKLVATFTQDSYVGVKTTDNADWFMTNGYTGEYAVARLYNTKTLGNPNKLYVPGGVEVTFTLEVHWDNTLSLSYTTGPVPSKEPVLTLKAPTLEFKDMITVNAFYTAENIDGVQEMGMITYSTPVESWSVETAEHVIPGTTYDPVTGRYVSASQGIHAKYLADLVYLAVYARMGDGTYVYSKLASYSPVQYAASKLGGTDTSLKQLVVAMLNYGAAAQTHFGHNTTTLANASLTAEQKALPAAYNSNMVSTVASVPAAKQGSFAGNTGFAKRYPSISFEGAFCINYFFTPSKVPVGGITLYYWTAKDYDAASVLTTANASGSLKMAGSGTGEYQGDITGIAAKALSEGVYVTAVYQSGGTTYTSGVLGYSIGAYCASQSTKGGTIADLAMATAVYGYHAKAYFG